MLLTGEEYLNSALQISLLQLQQLHGWLFSMPLLWFCGSMGVYWFENSSTPTSNNYAAAQIKHGPSSAGSFACPSFTTFLSCKTRTCPVACYSLHSTKRKNIPQQNLLLCFGTSKSNYNWFLPHSRGCSCTAWSMQFAKRLLCLSILHIIFTLCMWNIHKCIHMYVRI